MSTPATHYAVTYGSPIACGRVRSRLHGVVTSTAVSDVTCRRCLAVLAARPVAQIAPAPGDFKIVVGKPAVFSFDRVKPGRLASCTYLPPRPQRFGDRSCNVYFHGRAVAFELVDFIAGEQRQLLAPIPLTLLPSLYHESLSVAVHREVSVTLMVRNIDPRRTLSLTIVLEPLELV